MTFKLTDRYPGRVNEVTEQFVRGSFKNRSAPNSADGTYLEADWKNDERGFIDRILKVANVTPNGKIDNANESQVYDALISIVSNMINASGVPTWGVASGGSDAINVNVPNVRTLINGVSCYVRTQYRNTTSYPTINVNGLGEKAIVKGNNLPLLPGDVSGAGFVMHLIFDVNWDRWILVNPAYGVSQPESIPVGTISFFGRTGNIPGWLLCDSNEHNRADYPNLIAQCPQFIRAGSSASTFKLIDLRGYILRCLDSGRGIDPGRGFGTEQSDAMRNIHGKIGRFNLFTSQNCASGAFYAQNDGGFVGIRSGGWDHAQNVFMDASRQVPTANEFRMKNIAFPIYIKV